jgi:hypothetical protein
MSISAFFSSLAGKYAAQSFCHSLIASVIMDMALKAWKIDDPSVRQRFRLTVVLFPVFSFPLYQAINPNRGDLFFRLDALFDINRWLNMEFWGIPLGLLFLCVLAITSLIFLFQEMVPILRHMFEAKTMEHEGILREPDPFMENASRALSIERPEIFTVDDDDLLIFSSTGRNPVIYISTGLTQAFTEAELQAALAHELAHIARSRRPLLLAAFFPQDGPVLQPRRAYRIQTGCPERGKDLRRYCRLVDPAAGRPGGGAEKILFPPRDSGA